MNQSREQAKSCNNCRFGKEPFPESPMNGEKDDFIENECTKERVPDDLNGFCDEWELKEN